MSQKTNLSEEHLIEIPEKIKIKGIEAFKVLWDMAQQIAQQEIDAVKKRYQQQEAEITQQRQEALNKIEQIQQQIVQAHGVIDKLSRENKSLQVDLHRHAGELKSAEDQISFSKEKVTQQEHEIKRLMEEIGRVRENGEGLKKRLVEISRQTEQDRLSLVESQEELAIQRHTRERLENNLKTIKQELGEAKQQLKQEQTKVAVAEALTREIKETIKKYEEEIKTLKEEQQEIRANLETEMKARIESEKKEATSNARTESQALRDKEMITRLEQELELAKSELATFRNRMIKVEGALEREKKAVERLETKLIATTGTKF